MIPSETPQFGVATDLPLGLPGTVLSSPPSHASETFRVGTGARRVPQILTLTASDADDDTEYVIRFRSAALSGPVDVGVTTGTSATATTLAAAFATEIGKEGFVGGILSDVTQTAGALALTLIPGVTATIEMITNPNTRLSVAQTQAPAEAARFLFGRFYPVSTDASDRDSRADNRALGLLGTISGAVVKLTVTHAESQTGQVAIQTTDPFASLKTFEVSNIATGADDEAFAEALASAFNDLEGVVAVAQDDDGWEVLVTLPAGFDLAGEPTASASGGADIDADVVSEADSLPAAMVFAQRLRAMEPETRGGVVVGPRPGEMVQGLTSLHGSVLVEDPGESITTMGHVWVETAAGDDRHRPYTTPSPTRIPLRGARWLRPDPQNPGVAQMRIDTLL